ncbi:hypothetical protein M431DRAFT_433801 [Trichoderma harzianum CBS 226.95]|uniref:Uncharacterized protein n=1 Tax=Trichoderma harzianum CBS 226.95 TaxID=983964 RepID=A0A2T4AD42_TRIHA|nr:hypothetical protein M431DRAFT_433801 [Trichoderma harzianum CBS 226.95]PTB54933.1 hypothetical protein M431DRAFT_433801 [Trichoderma harzianum CBS 226.95]
MMELGDVVAESALRSASSSLSSASLRRSREPLAEENCVSNLLKMRLGDAVAPDSASGCDPVSLVKSPGAWSWSTAGAIQPCEGIVELAWLSIEIAFCYGIGYLPRIVLRKILRPLGRNCNCARDCQGPGFERRLSLVSEGPGLSWTQCLRLRCTNVRVLCVLVDVRDKDP